LVFGKRLHLPYYLTVLVKMFNEVLVPDAEWVMQGQKLAN